MAVSAAEGTVCNNPQFQFGQLPDSVFGGSYGAESGRANRTGVVLLELHVPLVPTRCWVHTSLQPSSSFHRLQLFFFVLELHINLMQHLLRQMYDIKPH